MIRRVACLLLGVLFSFGNVLYSAPEQKQQNKDEIYQTSIVTVVGYDASDKKISQGNGFVIDDKGSIVTCWHTISNAVKVKAVRKDGVTVISNGILHSDAARDFAVIRIQGKRLSVLQLGDSDVVKKDDEVFVTKDSVKETDANGTITSIKMLPRAPILLKSSIKIPVEKSGSPLFNSDGHVIGMNVTLKSDDILYEFAVPINTIKAGLAASDKIVAYSESAKVDYNDTTESYFIKAILTLPEDPKKPESNKLVESSLELFRKAVEKKQDYPDAWFYTGYCLGELDKNEEALNAFKEAIKIRTEFAEAHFGIGLAAVKLAWNQDAVESFKEAIRIKPEYADAHYNLGLAYINMSWHKEAIDSFKNVIKINPNYAEAYYNLGVVYIQDNANQDAVDNFKKVVEITPDQVSAYFGLGVAQINLGLNKDAAETFKQAIKVKPDYTEAHFGLGVANLNLDNNLEAVESFKQAIRLKPEDADYSYNLGLAYEKLGMKEEAKSSLQQAIKLQPNYADARYTLGVVCLSLNDRGTALEEYQALKDIDPALADNLFKQIYP